MPVRIKSTAERLQKLCDRYCAEKKAPIESVHQNILKRAIKLLGNICPEAAELAGSHFDRMMTYVIRPDQKGDYENGLGRHYYSACNIMGKPLKPSGGYYKNGLGLFGKSARSMFEEDYTMALTLRHGGFAEESAEHLGRAVHMLSDMCCLPHAAKMTYFSPMRSIHKSYENLAEALYPEFIPEQKLSHKQLRRFSDRSSFTAALNSNAKRICAEIPELDIDPVSEIKSRLYDTEAAVAALLYRFYRDMNVSPERGHYLAGGMGFRIFEDMPPFTVRVTAEGISFEQDGIPVNTRFGSFFRAAHRRNGLFTFSPVNDDKGMMISLGRSALVSFDPRDEKQLFRMI